MKKLFLALLLAIVVLSGCMMQNRTFALGTSEAEFKSKDKWLTTMVEQSEERTVYKKIAGQNGDRYTYVYYYFVDGKLVRMDEGERQPTVVVEHVKS
ncbi:hypothetical protein ABIB62_003975 [Mucilaginibacter sp. UYP25]|uniref:hypothetical protein n=1 Tax=unclassified Mucilaginibacter TaxID=2617802 RepID=UPI00339AE301